MQNTHIAKMQYPAEAYTKQNRRYHLSTNFLNSFCEIKGSRLCSRRNLFTPLKSFITTLTKQSRNPNPTKKTRKSGNSHWAKSQRAFHHSLGPRGGIRQKQDLNLRLRVINPTCLPPHFPALSKKLSYSLCNILLTNIKIQVFYTNSQK